MKIAVLLAALLAWTVAVLSIRSWAIGVGIWEPVSAVMTLVGMYAGWHLGRHFGGRK